MEQHGIDNEWHGYESLRESTSIMDYETGRLIGRPVHLDGGKSIGPKATPGSCRSMP